MPKQCELEDRDCIRNKIAGLGERSFRKSYYPELQKIERFKALLDRSNDAIFLLGVPDGRFIDVNQSACDQLGHDRRDLLAMSIYDIMSDATAAIGSILEGNVRSIEFTTSLRCPHGRLVPYEINIRKVCFGGCAYAIAVARNIEERTLIERTLRESEEKFRVLAKTSTAVIYVYQGENLVYVNDAAERVTGYSKDELLKLKFWDIVHPDYREMVRERGLARQRGEPPPSPYEIKFITKSGETRWAELSAGQITFTSKPAGVATFFDITERKQAEKALIGSQQMLRLVTDNIPQAIFWKDRNSVYMGCNRVLARDVGLEDPGDIVGKTDYDLPTTREQTDSYRAYDQLVMDRDEPIYHIIEEQRRPDGTMAWLDTNKIPLHDSTGKVIGILCTYEDITERKQAEDALADAKALAELYVDLMSHDINNQNQVALGYLEMADDIIAAGGRLAEGNRALIKKPIESLNSSSRLIDNVMKLRKLKTRELRLEQVDICRVLSGIKDRYSQASGQKITINYVPPRECLVVANELIDEIFNNLIENAVKHSHKERPLVIDVLQAEVCEAGKTYFRISIEDNGPGIPDEIKDKLFTRYFRGKAGTKGKGLGLFLVKTLVEDFKGKVRVEDRVPGDHTKGARFVVMLPAAEH